MPLHRLPSAEPAAGVHALHGWARIVHGAGRFIVGFSGFLFVILSICACYLYFFGIESAQFTAMAQKAIQSIAGPGQQAQLTGARLSIDNSANLAFEADGITIADVGGRQVAHVDAMTMGLNPLSLIGGSIEIREVALSGVQLESSGQGMLMPPAIGDERGRLSPGKVPPFVNAMLRRLQTELAERKLESLTLTNVAIGKADSQNAIVVNLFEAIRTSESSFNVFAEVSTGTQSINIDGVVDEKSYVFDVDGLLFGEQLAYDAALNTADAIQIVPLHGLASFNISGLTDDARATMRVTATVPAFDYQSRRKVRVNGSASLVAELRTGQDKIEILSSKIDFGQNHIGLTGAIGPNPDVNASAGDYRFELVSNDSVFLPADSSESEVRASIRAAGTVSTASRTVEFSELGIRTDGGELYGRGSLRVGNGSPEIIFAFYIPSMRVAQAKHLWPAVFATGARRWVLAHVFGGELVDSNINISFAEGALWPRANPKASFLPTAEQISATFGVKGSRFDVLGDLPPVRDAIARIDVAGANTTIALASGTAFLENGTSVAVQDGILQIPVQADMPVVADLDVTVDGDVAAIADIANRDPIKALAKAPVAPSDLTGTAVAKIKATFPLQRTETSVERTWAADVQFKDLSIAKEFGGQKLTGATGTLVADSTIATFKAKGKLNGVEASVSLIEPLGEGGGDRQLTARLQLDDKARETLAPGLSGILSGPVELGLLNSEGTKQSFEAILDKATLSLPWAGWSKGAGIPAKATFTVAKGDKGISIQDLDVRGETFQIKGNATLIGDSLSRADFTKVSLNKGDNAQVSIERGKNGYSVDVTGQSLDLRALLKRVSGSFEKAAEATGGAPIALKAQLGSVTGFNGEKFNNVIASYFGAGSEIKSFAASASSSSGGNVALDNSANDGVRRVTIQTTDGGALLRFMDIYEKMQGGRVSVNLVSSDSGVLSGEVDARSFTVIGEPRLKTLAGTPTGPDGQPIAEARGKIDVSRVNFERGNAIIEKGKGYLKLKDGILRSAQFGLSYAGTLYDSNGNIDMTGTFLPIYGLNRIFGELPIFGGILGNGRDKGLIGITFKLAGNAKTPKLEVNPISLIAPGIFRQIFEFR